MDLAPYINDARALKLMLLGGGAGADMPGMHDWRNILLDLNLLTYEHFIGSIAYSLGAVLMLLSFLWGGYLLCAQHRLVRTL
jgi:hypothetical protein